MLKKIISNIIQDYEFSWVIESQMLVLPFDIKRLNPLNLKQGERPIGKIMTSYYHNNFTNTFQKYIHQKTFLNKIEHRVVTWWNIINYENQMTQLPFNLKKKFNLLNLIHWQHAKFLTMATWSIHVNYTITNQLSFKFHLELK